MPGGVNEGVLGGRSRDEAPGFQQSLTDDFEEWSVS